MGRLALRFGGQLTAPRVEERSLRSLLELSLDNAVEGCVRETWGALFGAFQAERSEDREVRRIMRVIANDEAEHASLAWQIAAWAEPQLTDGERATLRSLQEAAIGELSKDSATASQLLTRVAGVPDRAQTEQLLSSLRTRLWSSLSLAA